LNVRIGKAIALAQKRKAENRDEIANRSGGVVLSGLERARVSRKKPKGFHEATYLAEFFDTIRDQYVFTTIR